MKVTQLERAFEYNGIRFPDIPGYTIEQIKNVYAVRHAQLLNADVKGPEERGGKLIYTFVASAGTKA